MKKWWSNIRRLWRSWASQVKERNVLETRPAASKRTLSETAHKRQPIYERTTWEAIHWYGRRKVRRELKRIHRRLITEQPDSPLARRIRTLFPEAGSEQG